MTVVRQIPILELGRSASERRGVSEFSSDPRLRVTVVFTTTEGTLAALRAAGSLAKNLGARILLVVTEVVPLHFPVDSPPVSVQFLEQRQLDLVSASGIEADEVRILIYLCRDREKCLRKVLNSPSLVVVGGRKCWWHGKERKLEHHLRVLGHHVIFIEMEEKNRAGFLLRSYLHPVLRWVLDLHQGL
jgi:hypothetical protein